MNLLTTILAFAFALGSLIIVHEFGHYLAAWLCNVKVLRFSVGFGSVIASRRYGRDQTEWALAAFPLGGYVKMLDEREGEVAVQDLPRAFNRQSVYRRFLIVVAGPLANFLLAIFLYWLIFMHGMPGIKPVIGDVAPDSAAAQAGFSPGEIIARIGEEKVATWQDARWMLLKHVVSQQPIKVEVHNLRGEIAWRTLVAGGLKPEQLDSDFLAALGFLKQTSPIPSVLGELTPGGAAERAGLQAGDEVVAVDGRPVRQWQELVKIIRAHPGTALTFDVRRGINLLPGLRVTPDSDEERGQKIGKAGIRNPYFVEMRYGPLQSLNLSLARTWDTSVFSLRMLGKMIMGEVSLKNLSGPITIADYAGQSAQVGWIPYLIFLALISISLGVLNLLPIPLLDGGHLMYYMLEIAKGSPVSDRIMEIGQRVGMGVLFLLMACALYNDIIRLING
ncbi:MAG: RIP metalloprotease RseP [Betaproteobacteria bacterium]|nr:RIP metalloprotease RseP [Betaproteobacteria bacterium]